MFCKECRGKTIVIDTRSFEDEVYRKRKCLVCGRKFFTAEIEDDRFEDGKQGMYLFYKEWRSRH